MFMPLKNPLQNMLFYKGVRSSQNLVALVKKYNKAIFSCNDYIFLPGVTQIGN